MPVKITLPPNHNSTPERFSRTGLNCMWATLEEPPAPVNLWEYILKVLLYVLSASLMVWVLVSFWRSW